MARILNTGDGLRDFPEMGKARDRLASGLRSLVEAPYVIFYYPHPDRIDVYLTVQLQREPAEWERIRRFLDICEYRTVEQFAFPVRILTGKSSAQIFHAVARARTSNH